MSPKKKKSALQKKEDDFETKENDLGIPDGVEYDEVVLDREEAEDLLGKIQKLKKKLKTAEEEKKEYLDGWQRARGEYAKLKKDEEATLNEMKHRTKKNVLEEFLPVADSFNMAFSNQEAWEKVDENWRRGVEYIYSQLESVLEREGVRRFDPKGEGFDPKRHDSLETVEVENEAEDDRVVEVVQAGYETGDGGIIRPAKVKVGKFVRGM